MSKHAVTFIAPKDHPYYIALRMAAEVKGLLAPFRRVCMLLDAPADMGRGVFLRNLNEMLKRIPESWATGDCFENWKELIEWWIQIDRNENFPKEYPRAQDPRGGSSEIDWDNLQPVSIFWAAECEAKDARYLLLLAHLILTRYKDLCEKPLTEGKVYEDLYETYAGAEDFAEDRKSPRRAAAAISAIARRLSLERQQYFCSQLNPSLPPDKFGLWIPELLPLSLQDLEPLADRIKHYCRPRVVAPRDHPTYQAVCSALQSKGLREPFQRMCMILNAPPNLKPLPLVLRTVAQIIEALPKDWDFSDVFKEWPDVAGWILQNQQTLEMAAKARLDTDSRTRTVDGVTHNVHPMEGEGISKFHLFSMLCDVSEERRYQQLQAQILVARWQELSRTKGIAECIRLYEAYAGDKDFAPFARFPYTVSKVMHALNRAYWRRVIDYLRPERVPHEFAKRIKQSEIPLGLDGTDLSPEVWHIRNYCALETNAREDVQSGPRRFQFRRSPTFIPYNETRFGIEAVVCDEDDAELAGNVNSEWILDRVQDEQTSANQEEHPNEDTSSKSYLLYGRGGKDCEPGSRAVARAHVHHVEIDKERMPWSAMHLRPSEVRETLLAGLMSASLAAVPQTSAERSELEAAALVAVCLETGRSIEEAMELCFVSAGAPNGEFCFIPGANCRGQHTWCIKAIEPDYKTIRETDDKKELQRARHLLYPVHSVPGRLLSLLEQVTPQEGDRRAFRGSSAIYKKQVKDWLLNRCESKELPNSKRLTITKISGLKWRLLDQRCGCDFATASIVLGLHHRLGEVALHYSFISVQRAEILFQTVTDLIWESPSGSREENYPENR